MRRRTLLARAVLAAALWPLMDAALRACPICFQVENGHVAGGVRAAVVVLVSVTTAVVGVCAVFVGRLVRLQPGEPGTQNPNPGTPEPEPRNLGTPEPRNLQ